MTGDGRPSKRKVERILDDLETETTAGEYVDVPDLTPEEKEELADLFDVAPGADNQEAREFVENLRQNSEGLGE